mgnify:CR=1 FL=1
MNSLIKQEAINFEERLSFVRSILLKEEIGPSTKALRNAAKEYNLPVIQLANSGIYQSDMEKWEGLLKLQ